VPGDGRGSLVQIRLQLLCAADFSEECITLGGENAMDVLVFAVASGGNQLAQLFQVRDASRRHLTDSRRASLEYPLADRGHLPGRDGLRQARFLFPRAHGGVGWRRRFNSGITFADRRRAGRGR